MRIKFVNDFQSSVTDIKSGEEHEVIVKKEPDKFTNYIRYQIKIASLGALINVPEMFVEEMSERSH